MIHVSFYTSSAFLGGKLAGIGGGRFWSVATREARGSGSFSSAAADATTSFFDVGGGPLLPNSDTALPSSPSCSLPTYEAYGGTVSPRTTTKSPPCYLPLL